MLTAKNQRFSKSGPKVCAVTADKQFGGPCMEATMSTLSTAMATATLSATKEQVKSDIVTGTLNAINKRGKSGRKSSQSAMSDTYNMSQDVLSAAYSPVGAIVKVRS